MVSQNIPERGPRVNLGPVNSDELFFRLRKGLRRFHKLISEAIIVVRALQELLVTLAGLAAVAVSLWISLRG